jgi:uncharacterized protein involved in exopolysaccharide biosynthesis
MDAPYIANPRDQYENESSLDMSELFAPVLARWKTIAATGLAIGVLGFGGSYLMTPVYTAECVFMPPQQQSGASAALASLGALSNLVGTQGANRTAEQYVSLMQGVTISDRIVGKFDLKNLWDLHFQVDARKHLSRVVQIQAGKKDNLIRIDVTDPSPVRAAAIANQYVTELRTLTNGLAVTEAQQRRVFFERLLEQTRDKLGTAQAALESSGYSAGALNVEPRAAAESYATLKAQQTAADVRLQVLRSTLAETSPEVVRQRETVNALAAQLAKLEAVNREGGQHAGDYIGRYREFKYQETLFDLFARQYEAARVDEAREGSLIQVIDPAQPPERKSAPGHTRYGLASTMIGLLLAFSWLSIKSYRRMRLETKVGSN